MNKFKVTYNNDLFDIVYSRNSNLSGTPLSVKDGVVAVAFLGPVPEGHVYLKSQVV